MYENFPYSNFHDLNVDWIIKTINSLVADWQSYNGTWEEWKNDITQSFNDLNSYVMNYFANLDVQDEINNKLEEMFTDGRLDELLGLFVPYVTPEMFGAVGDGATDDSTAFQTALNTNKQVFLDKSKTYKLENTIYIHGENRLNGLGSKIVSNVTPAIVMTNYTGTQDHNAKPMYLENLNIQGNDMNTLIKIEDGLKANISNVNLYNFKLGIYYFSGYEILASNIRMVGNVAEAVGIQCDSSDGVFNDITMRDVQKAYIINGFHNTFNNLHSWILTPALFANSVMIESNTAGGGVTIYNNVYADTYRTVLKKSSLTTDVISNLTCILIKDVAISAGISGGTLVEFAEASGFNEVEYSGKVRIKGYDAQILNYDFYALTNKTNILIDIHYDNVSLNGFYELTDGNGALYTLANFCTLTEGSIKYKNGLLIVNGVFELGDHDFNTPAIVLNPCIYIRAITTNVPHHSSSSQTNFVSVVAADRNIQIRGTSTIVINLTIPCEIVVR